MGNHIKNVILISVDSLRFDAIGCEIDKRWPKRYGVDKLIDTPNIDWFAENGIRFNQCISSSSYTPAAHASMLTGTHSFGHGVKTFFGKLSSQVVTLSEVLNKNGFTSFATIEHPVLRLLDITRGISLMDEPLANEKEDLFSLLSKYQDKEKKFIFIHLFDVHKPYCYSIENREGRTGKDHIEIIRKIAERTKIDFRFLLKTAGKKAKKSIRDYKITSTRLRDLAFASSLELVLRDCLREKQVLFQELVPLYIEGVNRFDKGRFNNLIGGLRESGLLRDCLLIITSDHGEARLMWNGIEDFMNGFSLCESLIRVPLIFYAPDVLPKGKVIDAQASLVDIAPTILDILEIDYSHINFHGKSLIPLLEAREKGTERLAFCETWLYDKPGINIFDHKRDKIDFFRRQKCIRTRRFKYIETGEPLLEGGLAGLNECDFVKTAYRKILGRFENSFELIYWAHALRAKRIKRDELMNRLIKSMDRVNLRYMLFDLSVDPFEENNLFDNLKYQSITNCLRKEMFRYSAQEGISKELNKKEEELLKAHLVNLGYL